MYKIIIGTILLFWAASCKTTAQQKQLVQHAVKEKKTGYWIETDTVQVLTAISMGISHYPTSVQTSANEEHKTVIFREEGNYNNGFRLGLWKYFRNDTLAKEIIYNGGSITEVKSYWGGKLRVHIVVDRITEDNATVNEYDEEGNLEKTYTIPVYLLRIEQRE